MVGEIPGGMGADIGADYHGQEYRNFTLDSGRVL